tara:strand:+ start:41904 stop:42401 length:498 start_codon:yes stop_codon:yes gene_type:complete
MSTSNASLKTASADGKLLENWRYASSPIELKPQNQNQSAAQNIKHQELLRSYKADLLKTVDLRVDIGVLANDNGHKAPDWGLFNTAHIHPSLNKVQKIATMLGLALGLVYAALVVAAAPAVSVPFMIYSYLTYGLVGTIIGYFSLWLMGAAVIVSPILLIAALIL